MRKKSLIFFGALIALLSTFGISDAYLDSETGRFITQDPYLGEVNRPPSLHRYNYVKSNPTAFVDRNGYDYVEVQGNKAYWVIEKDVPGPFNPDMRRVHIGNTKEQNPKNIYLTSEFGDGTVGLKTLKQGASSYWGRYDIEEKRSIFNPADISSLDPSLQDQLIRHYIYNRMDPHNQGGIYADRPRFRSKTTRNLDRIQTTGDFAGMAPGIGNVVDVANTALYGVRGKWKDFGFGAAAMLPIVGQGSTAAKYGKKGGTIIDNGIKVVQKTRSDFYISPGGQAIPSRGYRAIGGESNIAEALEGTISSRNPTYITFNNLRGMNSQEVQSLLQLPKTPSHAVKFDTLQILDDLSIPTGKWNTTNIPEPITTTFPKWGKGGGTQAITNQPIIIDDMWRLRK
jgi:hypothetical protein